MRRTIDEHDFFVWLSALNRVAAQRYRARDTKGLVQVLNRYQAMNGMARKDPLLSTLETATVHAIRWLAQTHLDDLKFESCFALLDMAAQVLTSKSNRLRSTGNQPKPDSIAWCCVIDTLADAQWKAPDEYMDAVLTLDNMIYRWRLAEESIRRGLRAFPRDESRTRKLMVILESAGCQLIRNLMRHQPERIEWFLKVFTNYHGEILSNSVLPYYWELLITEMYLSGNINPSLLDEYYERLESADRNLCPGLIRTAMDFSWINERRYILRKRRRNLVLLTD